MSRYQSYPEYKDSGVEWLREIPKHWRCTQVKYGYDVTLGKMLQKVKSSCLDELRPYLKAQNIQPNGVDLNSVDMMWFSPEERKKLLLKPQDVLVSEGGDVGRSAIWREQLPECYIQNAINRVRANNGNSPTFFHYWLSYLKLVDFISILCNKATIAHYTAEKLESSPLVLPSIEEQNQIALFLDHETAKIDALIEKQQQLIELLKEKRHAVISHAVTKGLNPDVPMKDSGVEWLGEIPSHWAQIKLKYITNQIIDAEHKTAEYFDDGEYLVCRTTNVRYGKLCLDGGLYTNLETYTKWIKRGKPEVGDILFTREAPAGEACVYFGDVPLCLGQRMVLFKLNVNRVHPEFVLHSIYSGLSDDFIKQLSQGSTVTHFNMADIQNIPLYEPPLEEQKYIIKYLERVLSKYDGLVQSAENMISLMQERRTALIAAAVTGKIDVRNWVAPTNDTEVNQEPQEATA
jgi:type I restriction enzyme S subunit